VWGADGSGEQETDQGAAVRILAYLDGGSASMIASAVAAGFAGVAVVIKMGWRRMLTALSPKRRRAAEAAAAATAPNPTDAQTTSADPL
jgi:hypothetical protein